MKVNIIRVIFFTINLILISSYLQGQDFQRDENGQINYSEIINVPLDSTILYLNMTEWFGKSFRQPESQLIFNDKVECKIIGTGAVSARMKSLGKIYDAGLIKFTLEIKAKKGRYKYEFSDFNFIGSPDLKYVIVPLETEKPPGYLIKKQWSSVKNFAIEDIENLIKNLKITIAQKDDGQW